MSEIRPGFDSAYYESNSQSGDRLALRFYARLARRLAPPDSIALDYGSGTGYFSRRLSANFQSLAYDLSPYARSQTALTSPATRVIDDTADLPDGSVDLICSLHVLEHVPDPSVAFAEFARLLRVEGQLLFVVPNPQGWGHRIKKQGWFAYRDPTHCSLLSRDAWVASAVAHGFRVRRVSADGLWDPPYVAKVPKLLQLAVAGAPAALQVALGRCFLPPNWGECIIVSAQREIR